jgi:hypothetical protein
LPIGPIDRNDSGGADPTVDPENANVALADMQIRFDALHLI